ncbi:MAG: SDR family NAD(P)-dependent oxidoreductase [Deltaproteobacteria bacterium]|nr:SDR family NAD(P)-dependent oxidoreductase [Deltaproteobacteria bacterium]
MTGSVQILAPDWSPIPRVSATAKRGAVLVVSSAAAPLDAEGLVLDLARRDSPRIAVIGPAGPVHEALRAFAASVAAERRGGSSLSVELDPADPDALALANELAHDPEQTGELRLAQGQLWRREWRPVTTPRRPQAQPRVVLVTGGLGGVGRLVAEHLARGGARVTLVGRSPLSAAARSWLKKLPNTSYSVADVCTPEGAEAAVAAAGDGPRPRAARRRGEGRRPRRQRERRRSAGLPGGEDPGRLEPLAGDGGARGEAGAVRLVGGCEREPRPGGLRRGKRLDGGLRREPRRVQSEGRGLDVLGRRRHGALGGGPRGDGAGGAAGAERGGGARRPGGHDGVGTTPTLGRCAARTGPGAPRGAARVQGSRARAHRGPGQRAQARRSTGGSRGGALGLRLGLHRAHPARRGDRRAPAGGDHRRVDLRGALHDPRLGPTPRRGGDLGACANTHANNHANNHANTDTRDPHHKPRRCAAGVVVRAAQRPGAKPGKRPYANSRRRPGASDGDRSRAKPGSAPSPVPPRSSPSGAAPIAIVGYAARLPGPPSLAALHAALCAGDNWITRAPADRWDWREWEGDPAEGDNHTDCHLAARFSEIRGFDAEHFHISPREAALMDPSSACCSRLSGRPWSGRATTLSLKGARVASRVGAGRGEYGALLASKHAVEAHTNTGNTSALLSNRLAWFYGWTGPSHTLDAGCAGSMVAIAEAVATLRRGDASLAVAGGVSLILAPHGMVTNRRMGLLTASGRVRSYDDEADGHVFGEGAGLVVLKPLDRALADGDTVFGVIRGVSVNHSGRTPTLTTPSALGQAQAIRDASPTRPRPRRSLRILDKAPPPPPATPPSSARTASRSRAAPSPRRSAPWTARSGTWRAPLASPR